MFNKKDPFQGMPDVTGLTIYDAYDQLEVFITPDWIEGAIGAYFGSQKKFADFIGVGASTVTNWVKTKSFPDHAKRLLVYLLLEKLVERSTKKRISDLEIQLSNLRRPMVVEERSSFSILSSASEKKEDVSSLRKLVAREIPDLSTALRMAGSNEIWDFMEELQSTVLGGELLDVIKDACHDLYVEEEYIDNVVEEVRRYTTTYLQIWYKLRNRWTDPAELQALREAMENIDWSEAFPDSVQGGHHDKEA